MREIIILTHVITDSVNTGFIPAAQRLGLSVVLLTDNAEAHREYFSQSTLSAYPAAIFSCDVFNPLAVIEAVTRRPQKPAAIFSNSDHLQTSTAIAADYFGLPCKNWHVTYRAKHKAEMRAELQRRGIDGLWYAVVSNKTELEQILDSIPFPCITKPCEGVASQQVSLIYYRTELKTQCAAAWNIHPGQSLLIEEYIEGPLYTLETLGDNERLHVLGGFQVKLSPPPHFIELEASWGTGLTVEQETEVLNIIRNFGIGFGACHTEFVMTGAGPRLIEINYRNIGDYREFMLQDALDIPLFELVLRLYLGESLPHMNFSPGAALIRYFTASSGGRLLYAPEPFFQQVEDIQITFKPLRAIGDMINLTNSNKDYLGVLRGTGLDAQYLCQEMSRIGEQLVWEIDS
ncbi:ATP-grasp domain-containing protein [Nitrosomonas aestuarii]|uniref:ATP-grasp domain-containing protein n=1 Tax=Nitrosomonas aestuarii TaxID=52441 RepID=UPI000D32106B|nr:ATP-grasp domain-containing protein [Nitrosomonas aestuarii]PTN12401.1 ATP-grasp domain-containing protein [Nitrosomonas aestuarii]